MPNRKVDASHNSFEKSRSRLCFVFGPWDRGGDGWVGMRATKSVCS